MKVAYVILAHGNPEQLGRLVSALPRSSPILIHLDRRAGVDLQSRCTELFGSRPGLHFVDRHLCYWGAFGIVQGTITLLEALVNREPDFDYVTLLSGADYPIKSNREIAAFLEQNRGKEFIESFLLTAPNRWSTHGGYYKTPEKVLCRHLRFRSRVLRLPGLRRMPADLRPYGGSQWWTLSKAAATYIVEFVRRTPEFVAFSKRSFIPDESFVQTIISNSHLADRVVADDLRMAVWNRLAPPYPAILKGSDLGELLASPKLFARKFDARIDSAILDELDRRNALRDEPSERPLENISTASHGG